MGYDKGMAEDVKLPTETEEVLEELKQDDLAGIEPNLQTPSDPLAGNKTNKKLIFVIAAAAIIVVLALLVTRAGRRSNTTTAPGASAGQVDLSRYGEDPDSDRIASFIEKKIGYDPNVSELDRCFNTKCDTVNTEEIKAIPRNVMILLDSSGSMEQKVGDQTKMDSAKIAIKEYLKKASSLQNTRVGLIVYGHKGSNSLADKEASCQSAEIKVPLGELKVDMADGALAEIRPVGWTPIGLALREAVKSFQVQASPSPIAKASPDAKPTKVINEVVIISDGVETCDTNPVQAAKELYDSQDKVVVHVIGFAVESTADNKALREISQAAGGTYATAPTIDELKLAMDLQWDNYVRRAREDACRIKGYENFLVCTDEALAKVNAYVSAELARDPRQLTHEEKLKIDRIRHVFPAYIRGTLDPLALSTVGSPATTPNTTLAPSPNP